MGTNVALTSLKDFFSRTQELLFTADRHGSLLGVSEPLARVLGSGGGKGLKLSARVHPEDRRAFRKEWTKIGKSVEPVQFECRLKSADGACRAWSWWAQASAKGGIIHGSLRNAVAGRDGAIGELEAQARILRLVQENIPLVVWAIDRQGIFTHHAGRGLVAAGLAQGQWLGQNVFDLYAGAPDGLAGIQQALAGELTHSSSEAHGLHWESWQIPVRDEHGEVTAVVGISQDVSEAKRAEAALRTKIELIERQQQVIRMLSTPIIEVWDRIVMLPLLGVLDTGRAAEVMQSLLMEVGKKGARFAVLDLTGVEMMDTATAGHLLRLIHAIRLLGAVGVISGIQPAVAQTMVSLGIDLKEIATLANVRDALRYCIARVREGGTP